MTLCTYNRKILCLISTFAICISGVTCFGNSIVYGAGNELGSSEDIHKSESLGLSPPFGVSSNIQLSPLCVSPPWISPPWDGVSKSDFSGLGTLDDPYQIANGSNLAYLSDQVNMGVRYEDTYFKLTSNIDLNNQHWTPIGNESKGMAFEGTLDGDGFYINNLCIINSHPIPCITYDDVVIHDNDAAIHDDDVVIHDNDDAIHDNNATIHDSDNAIHDDVIVVIHGDVNSCNPGLFGVLGKNGVVQNIYIKDGFITGNDNVGGIISINYGYIHNSINNSFIRGNNQVGGIVGRNYGIVLECKNEALINSYGHDVGGIVGFNASQPQLHIEGIIDTSTNSGFINGNENVGGIVGNNTGTVDDCCNINNMIKGNFKVGGIAGHNEYTISSCCNNNFTVYGDNGNVGGIAGTNQGSLRDCSNSVSVFVNGKCNVGGVVGYNTQTVCNCLNYSHSIGLFSCIQNTGPIIGLNEGSVLNLSDLNSPHIRYSVPRGYCPSPIGDI